MSSYRFRIEGENPLLMCDGLNASNPSTDINRAIKEITSKRIKAESDHARLAELKCQASIWWDESGKPEIPVRVFRAAIEAAAKKSKEGPLVREGLMVASSSFEYDTRKYGTEVNDLVVKTQFTVDGVMSGRRIPVTRARFDCPWAAEVEVEVDDELVDEHRLKSWIELAGRRLGIGAWRPAKSGHFGTFKLTSFEKITA